MRNPLPADQTHGLDWILELKIRKHRKAATLLIPVYG